MNRIGNSVMTRLMIAGLLLLERFGLDRMFYLDPRELLVRG